MMNFESLDRKNEPESPSGIDEFEKLEFLPEDSSDPDPVHDNSADIIFTPEDVGSAEPPVSFSPDVDQDIDFGFNPAPDTELGTPLPFELLGSSLFDDTELDDDLDPLTRDDFDDDLEF